jgi:hypothetical protein
LEIFGKFFSGSVALVGGKWVWIREKWLWNRPDDGLETGFEFGLLLALEMGSFGGDRVGFGLKLAGLGVGLELVLGLLDLT